jgi:hypothetical protein
MMKVSAGLLIAVVPVCAIELRIYSEFQRVDPMGAIVAQDRAAAPREILSPAVVRNAFASFQVIVTAPANTFYFLSVQTNPPGIFEIKLYRETFARNGTGFVSHGLIEERDPAFLAGVTPSMGSIASQTASAYLLDVWIPASVQPGKARLEVLVKTADWKVAPLEMRILPAIVPTLASCLSPIATPEPAASLDALAFNELFPGLAGDPPRCAPRSGTVASVIIRNARQDAALAHTFTPHLQSELLNAALDAVTQRSWTLFDPRGSESYLRVRQLLYARTG